MDSFLNSFSERSSSQKILIIVGGSVVLLLILAGLYFLATPSSNTSKNQVQNQNSQAPQSTQNTQNTEISKQSSNKLQSYSSQLFSINYPQEFSYQQGTIIGDGTSLTLKPQTQNSLNAIIEIQTYNSSVASQSAVEGIFASLGYQKSDIMVNSIPAKEFTGSVKGQSTLEEKAIIFTYGSNVYKLQLSYDSPNQNASIEQIFNDIVSSFKPQ